MRIAFAISAQTGEAKVNCLRKRHALIFEKGHLFVHANASITLSAIHCATLQATALPTCFT